MNDHNPYAPPRSDPGGGLVEPLDEFREDIELLEVSGEWKRRFRLIEKAGGARLPKLGELSSAERASVRFNGIALLAGPVYYFAKGMWRKAIVYFGLTLFAMELAERLLGHFGLAVLGLFMAIVGPIAYGTRANVDYYRKKVLFDDGWW